MDTRLVNIGYLCFIATALLYGTFGLFIRALQAHFSDFGQVAVRSLGALLVAIVWAISSTTSHDRRAFFSLRVWGFGITFPIAMLLWTISIVWGTVRSGTFGLYFGSLTASILFGRIFFQESITGKKIFCVAIALLGAATFILPFDIADYTFASVCIGALGGCVQSLNLCYRRWLGDVSRPVVLVVQGAGGFVLCAGLAALVSPEIPTASIVGWGLGLGYGALSALVSYLLLVGARYIELSRGAIVLASDLVWATLFSALALGEIPTPYQLVGCALLLGSTVIGKL
jgi:drug/metabolite transporter (DMT)-like permease